MHAYFNDDDLFVDGVDFKRVARNISKLGLPDVKDRNDALNLAATLFGFRNYHQLRKEGDRPLSARKIPYSLMSKHMREECDLADVKRLAVEPLGVTFKDQCLPNHFGKQWQSSVMALLHRAIAGARDKPGHLVIVVGKSKSGKTIALKNLAAISNGVIFDNAFSYLPIYETILSGAKRKLKVPEIYIFDGGLSHTEARHGYDNFRAVHESFKHAMPDPVHKDGKPFFYTLNSKLTWGHGPSVRYFGDKTPQRTPWKKEIDGVVRLLSVSSVHEANRGIFGPSIRLNAEDPFEIEVATIVNLDSMELTYQHTPKKGTAEFEAVMKDFFML